MNQQNLLLKIDDNRLRAMCDALPLRQTDRQIAYALALLCSRSGAYAPDHGVGQSEIARLAGLGVRTVQRRIKYLSRYGILSIRRENGRANVYEFDLVMLFDCPPATNDIYKRIKANPEPAAQGEPQPTTVPDSLPLFDREALEAPATPAKELPILARMARVAGGFLNRFTKRTFTSEEKPTPAKTAATSDQTPANPRQNRRHLERNPRHFSFSAPKTAAISEETPAIPPPISSEPPPTAAKTAAIFPTLHNTLHNQTTHLKNYTLQKHVHVDLENDSDFEPEPPPDPDAPGFRRIRWPRSLRDDDLKNPAALQELYEVAVDQGFFLDLDTARLNFFALAHYCCRAKKSKNKTGLFSTLADRTIKDKFNQPFEEKLTQADEDWAIKAMKHLDSPAYTTIQERLNQP